MTGPGEPAAVGHRVARIDGRVEQRRLELFGIGQAGQRGCDVDLDLDPLVEGAPQHVGQRLCSRASFMRPGQPGTARGTNR